MKRIGRVVTKLCSGHGVTDTHTQTEGQTDGHTAIIELPAAAKNYHTAFELVNQRNIGDTTLQEHRYPMNNPSAMNNQ